MLNLHAFFINLPHYDQSITFTLPIGKVGTFLSSMARWMSGSTKACNPPEMSHFSDACLFTTSDNKTRWCISSLSRAAISWLSDLLGVGNGTSLVNCFAVCGVVTSTAGTHFGFCHCLVSHTMALILSDTWNFPTVGSIKLSSSLSFS